MIAGIVAAQRVAAGGGPAGSRLHWRILFQANDGNASFDGIGEMEYRATVGGADQVPAQTAPSASVTSSSVINGSNDGWHAFDDNTTGSGWLSSSAGASWVAFTFASAVAVGQVSIIGPWNSITSSPKDFQIQYSDDKITWTTVLTVTGQTGWAVGVARVFTVP